MATRLTIANRPCIPTSVAACTQDVGGSVDEAHCE